MSVCIQRNYFTMVFCHLTSKKLTTFLTRESMSVHPDVSANFIMVASLDSYVWGEAFRKEQLDLKGLFTYYHLFQATVWSKHSLADVGEISMVKTQVQIFAGAEQIRVTLYYLVPEDNFLSFCQIPFRSG